MNLSLIRTNLAALIDNVSGLRAFPTVPGDMSTPAAIVLVGEGVYDETFEGAVTIPLSVYLLVSTAGEIGNTQDLLDGYLDPTGSNSVKNAIDADPELAGAASSTRVLGWDGYGSTYTFGANDYIGARLMVEVYA